MSKLRIILFLLLIATSVGGYFYYRANEPMHKRGLELLKSGSKSNTKRIVKGDIKGGAKGYDGSDPFEILSNQLITPHYNIHTNLDYERLDYFEKFFEGFYEYFDREIMTIKQPERLEVFLFGNLKYYLPFAERIGGPRITSYGFYLPGRNIIVVNANTGLGTTGHELAHHFIYCGFDRIPADWVNEGIASFFEKFIGYIDESGDMKITLGYFSNVRLPYTLENLKDFSLPALIARRRPPQAPVRSFIMFLHKKGIFKEFIRLAANSKDDPYALGALEKVYSKPVDEIEAEWKKWVLELPMDNDTFLVKKAFVKTSEEWKTWWDENGEKLYYDPDEKIYHVKEEYKEHYYPAEKKRFLKTN